MCIIFLHRIMHVYFVVFFSFVRLFSGFFYYSKFADLLSAHSEHFYFYTFFLFCFFIFLDIPFMFTIISFGHIHNSNVNAPFTYIHFWRSYSSTLSHIHTFTITAPYYNHTIITTLAILDFVCFIFFIYVLFFFESERLFFRARKNVIPSQWH